MPIQAPQWTDFLTCPICYHDYDNFRLPVSLACSHTVCIVCLSKLHRKQCPFDQTIIRDNIDNWPINYALLQLLCYESQDDTEKIRQHTFYAKNAGVVGEDISRYLTAIRYVEEIALFLKPSGSSDSFSVLSRPMQKRIITILNCQLLESEGRLRAIKAARSVGERTVTELLIQHQNPQQLSSNLWAAVRSRGCQFLGPAMQEEVLKLVLLALEDGSAISRKVLVMFIVQRLELQFPQASKTSIGHVVQLLYRASCFIVSKRESDSSLMRLKEEFRTYEALRREHDTQIVEIALEAGLRIAPDQWSALLYGDTTHKSHMQSIIDKLQTPGSFVQSVQELIIVLQRTGDPANLSSLRMYLEYLASIDVANECRYYDWEDICKALEAVSYVVAGLVNFMCLHAVRKNSCSSSSGSNIRGVKYKVSLCRDFMTKTGCPRGANCTFAHCEEELMRHRNVTNVKSPIHQYKDKPNEMFVEENDVPQTSSDSVKNSDSLGINKYFLHLRNRSISTNAQLPITISWPAYNSHDNITSRAEDAEEILFNDNYYSLWNQSSETKNAVDFCTLKNAEEVLNSTGQESFYDVNVKPNLLSSSELNLPKIKNNPVDFDVIHGSVNENESREFDGKILSKNSEYGSSAINNDGVLRSALPFDDSSLLFSNLCSKSVHSTCNATLDPEFKYPQCILSHYQSSRQNMCENFSEPLKYSETENLQSNTATDNIYSPLEIIKDMKKLELFYEEKK